MIRFEKIFNVLKCENRIIIVSFIIFILLITHSNSSIHGLMVFMLLFINIRVICCNYSLVFTSFYVLFQAPVGENQPSTDVDLFVSAEKIMVLNTDLQVKLICRCVSEKIFLCTL